MPSQEIQVKSHLVLNRDGSNLDRVRPATELDQKSSVRIGEARSSQRAETRQIYDGLLTMKDVVKALMNRITESHCVKMVQDYDKMAMKRQRADDPEFDNYFVLREEILKANMPSDLTVVRMDSIGDSLREASEVCSQLPKDFVLGLYKHFKPAKNLERL